MADTQIPSLSVILALAGPEEFEVVQAGVSSRVALTQISNYVLAQPGANLQFMSPLLRSGNIVTLTTVPVGMGGTGLVSVPANRLVFGNNTTPLGSVPAGSTGQMLVGSTGGPPTWQTFSNTMVTSFSAGTTGFTPSTASTGTVTLGGILQIDNGGTGSNLGLTGGTNRVLMQTTLGGVVTVAQLSAASLSNGTTGTGLVVLHTSPSFSGVPLAPTATPSTTNTTQIATTAFVQSARPTTLPPSGNAGGALTGTYPNPTLVGGPLSDYAKTSSLPTTLPPSGNAGGGLTGTYPNPAIAPGTNGFVLTTVGGVAVWQSPTAGGGTVISVSVVSANGLAGTVANPTLSPAITLTTTVTGMLKGNGTAISAATAGTDYMSPANVTAALGAYLPLTGGTLTGGLTGTSATFSGNVSGAAGIFSSSVSAGAASTIEFTSRTKFTSSADGMLLVSNNGVTSFTRMQLGGTTASFPAIKRNLAAINFRLADDTADAAITAGAASFTGTLTGTSATLSGTLTASGAVTFNGAVTLSSTLTYGGVLLTGVTGTGNMVLSANPTFTGDPKAPTQVASDNDTSIATTAFVKSQAYAPLASPAFTGTPTAPTAPAATDSTQIATTAYVKDQAYAPLASPAFTGVPTAPTATAATDSTQIATTAYVKDQNYAPLASPAFTGTPTAPTAAVTDNDTQVATTAFVRSIVPPGTIVDYAGAASPGGWLLCNGAAVSRTTYAALFAAISTVWGAGDGSTTFNVPDLRGRVTAGKETTAGGSRLTAAGSGIVGDTLGSAGGAQTHTLSTAQLANHQHGTPDHVHSPSAGWFGYVNGGQIYGYLGGTEGNWVGIDAAQNITGGIPGGPTLTGGAGSGSAHQNTQPTIIVNKIIKI